MQEAITYKDLKISLLDIVYMEKLEMIEAVNTHAKMKFTAVLKDKIKEENIHKIGELVTLTAKMGEEVKSPFYGKITDIRMVTEGDVYKLKVEASDLSYEMDIFKRKKSFQDINMTLSKIIKNTMSNYKESDSIITIPDRSAGELIVQYRETDWQFMIRLASMCNQGIYPQTNHEGIRLYVGVPNMTSEAGWEKKEPVSYHISKNIEEFNRITKNGGGMATSSDFVTYTVEDHEYIPLGSEVNFLKQTFHVIGVTRYLKEGLLLSSYQLRKKNGHRYLRIYNQGVTGASVDGTVLEINRDKIKVQLSIDGPQDKKSAYWFPFSTVAASKDGSGWYSMPKSGDEVRAYFPVNKESEAYVITKIGAHIPAAKEDQNSGGGASSSGSLSSSSNSGGSSGNSQQSTAQPPSDPMGDPKNKNITIPNGDSINLVPEGVQIFAAGKKASILLNMDGSVAIDGTNNLSIGAVEEISIRAEKQITINGVQTIDLLCEESGHIELLPGGLMNLDGKEIIEN